MKIESGSSDSRKEEIMSSNASEIETKAAGNNDANSESLQRFVVFVAGGKRPIISFENFARAERLALFFARLVNVRMEVFDSTKEICYFVEPSPSERCFRSLKGASF
jgi:hypothetical protein